MNGCFGYTTRRWWLHGGLWQGLGESVCMVRGRVFGPVWQCYVCLATADETRTPNQTYATTSIRLLVPFFNGIGSQVRRVS